jgi:hypothetical protein
MRVKEPDLIGGRNARIGQPSESQSDETASKTRPN